jgi:hypothetical protein
MEFTVDDFTADWGKINDDISPTHLYLTLMKFCKDFPPAAWRCITKPGKENEKVKSP